MNWLDLAFPPFCQSCARPGQWICSLCWKHIQWLEQPTLKPQHTYPSLKRVWSVATYDQTWGNYIQKLKYSRYRVLAHPLGKAMAKTVLPYIRLWKIECLIPVPIHRKRRWERGFNQATLLAQTLGEFLDLPVETNLLDRPFWQGTQAQQGRDSRKNVQYMFRCQRRAPFSTVCLVDDVYTTGATLSACARALNQAGVKTIVAITLARA